MTNDPVPEGMVSQPSPQNETHLTSESIKAGQA